MSSDDTPEATPAPEPLTTALPSAAHSLTLALAAMQDAEEAVALAVRRMGDRAQVPGSDDSQP